ncbi:unnamed protein product [Prunus armeniaca]
MWCLTYGDWECPLGKTISRHIPTHFQSIGSVKWGPISKEQEDEVERVRSLLLKAELAGIIKGSTKVVVDIDDAEMQKQVRDEIATARAEAIESFRTSKDLNSFIMDRLVHEQLRWEDKLMRFNPSIEINFDMSGEPLSPSPTTDDTVVAIESKPATRDAPLTES